MTQHYSNPKQENDPGALPDLEVFYVYPGGPAELRLGSGTPKGWYWQRHRTDGDLLAHLQTVGDVIGPFATEWEALADAREGVEDEDTNDDGDRDDSNPEPELDEENDYFQEQELPPCVRAMRCYCAGHARGNPVDAPCDTSESADEPSDDTDPPLSVVYRTLERAIEEVCDEDMQNEISDAYRALIEKWRRGVVRKDGSS